MRRVVEAAPPRGATKFTEVAEAKDPILSIRIQYKGEEETVEFTGAIIHRLVLEAEFRHLRIDELVRKLIITTMNKGLLQLVLGSQKRADHKIAETQGCDPKQP
jgi:hypothetical protein